MLINQKTKNNISIYISLGLMLLLIFFRYGYGADYFAYEHMYYRIKLGSLNNILRYYNNIGVGFKLLIALFRTLNIPFHGFIVVINTISLFFIYKWINDNSDDISISLLLFYSMFFFVWTFSALRQGLVLAIALYTLFNPKIKLSLRSELLVIIGLSLIHPSALILLLYKILDKVNWNPKKQLIFLILSILITLLPLNILLSKINYFPLISLIDSSYFNETVRFYDFPGVVRLVLFGFVFYTYKVIDKEEIKNHINRFLYGTSLYFLFKFSEITASRLTIYSFIMLVIIIPIVFNEFKSFKYARLSLLGIVMFSSLFFNKEVNALAYQSAHLPSLEKGYTQFETIVDKNIDNFATNNSHEIYVKEITYDILMQIPELKKISYVEGDSYVSVKKGKEYIIINQDGKQLEEYKFKFKPEIIEDMVIEKVYPDGYFFSQDRLVDLSDKNRSQEELQKVISKHNNKNHTAVVKEKYEKKSMEDFPHSIQRFYKDNNSIKRIITNKIYDEKPYKISRIKYFKLHSFVYLDNNDQPLFDIPFKNAKPFNNEEIISLESYIGTVYVTKSGKIIWWEK